MPQRILTIEDEPAIADTLTYALSTGGFETVWCSTGEAALAALGQSFFAIDDGGGYWGSTWEQFKRKSSVIIKPIPKEREWMKVYQPRAHETAHE